MIPVIFPTPDFKTKTQNGRTYIFDIIRRRWLLLQEEEWVRQNFIAYLTRQLHYPAQVIAVEKELQLGALKKRFDILVYDALHQPWMLIECKAAGVPLTDGTMHQLLRYHIALPAAYLVITNGTATQAWKKENNTITEIAEMPVY